MCVASQICCSVWDLVVVSGWISHRKINTRKKVTGKRPKFNLFGSEDDIHSFMDRYCLVIRAYTVTVFLMCREICDLILRVASHCQYIKCLRLKWISVSFPAFSRIAFRIYLKMEFILLWRLHVQATRKTKIWWQCLKRSGSGCWGSMMTNLLREHPESGQPHNHLADQA